MKLQRIDDNKEEEDAALQQLPEAILQHILSYFEPDEAAYVGMISKTLYNAWSLQPVLKLHFDNGHGFGKERLQGDGNESSVDKGVWENFLNYASKSMERYRSHNRCPQELHLIMRCQCDPDPDPDPSVNMEGLLGYFEDAGVRAIHVRFTRIPRPPEHGNPFPNLFRVLRFKTLVELHAQKCGLKQQISKGALRCSLMRRLSLENVHIDDPTLESIILNCRLLEKLQLLDINGLRRVKVVNLNCLKEFSISKPVHFARFEQNMDVDVEAPSIESIDIKFVNRFKLHPSSHLKNLRLEDVDIEAGFLENLTDNFPNLEELSLVSCSAFKRERFKIESKSLKSLLITDMEDSLPEINAPNLVSFDYVGSYIPSFDSVESFTRNLRECHIELLDPTLDLEWFVDLKEMLNKLIQFKVTLIIMGNIDPVDPCEVDILNSITWEAEVELEHLWLDIEGLSSLSEFAYSTLLDNLFQSCRTKSVCFSWRGSCDKPFYRFLCQRLMEERNPPDNNKFQWENFLKNAKMEMIDRGQNLEHILTSETCKGRQIVPSVDCKTFVHHLLNFLSEA